MPGPISKSPAENARNGNPGKRGKKHSSPIDQPSADWVVKEPAMPTWLSKEAKEHWRQMVPMLMAKGLICELDGPVLSSLCALHGRAVSAEKELAKGVVKILSNKAKQQKVELKIAKEAWSAYYQYAEKFGLTPLARSRMRLPALRKADGSTETNEMFGD